LADQGISEELVWHLTLASASSFLVRFLSIAFHHGESAPMTLAITTSKALGMLLELRISWRICGGLWIIVLWVFDAILMEFWLDWLMDLKA